MTRFTASLALALFALTPTAFAADKPVAIGDRVGDLSFKDIRYLPRDLSELGKKKAFVIVAASVSCPLNNRYWPKLKKLAAELEPKGVQFLALNVEPGDTIKAIAEQALQYDVPFPFVQDIDGASVAALGLSSTAQVAVLDAKKRLRYRGRIDNQYRFGGSKPKADRQELREALTALLAGQAIAVAETPVDGCAINAAPKKPAATLKPTYAREISRLMQKHCQDCHRPGGLAPFNLLSYDEARRNAAMIAQTVGERRMPPWYGSDKDARFSNHRGLNEEERALFQAWVENGAPRGDASEEPKPLPLPKPGWRIGKPDLILTVPTVTSLPADGYVAYKYFILPTNFTDDVWVDKIEIRGTNDRVLHHCNLIAITFENGQRQNNFITGVVPGSGPTEYMEGTAVRLPKGANLVLQAHYTTTGKPEKDQLSLGLHFPRVPVRKEVKNARANNRRFKIPARASHHRVDARITIPEEAFGLSLFSHMHLRGKDMSFFANYPDGRRERLLVIPNYSFDWQQSYDWEVGQKRFPKGTVIEVSAHYDNSPFNPFNPDASKKVGHGDQTYHEMMFGFVFYVSAKENLGLLIDPKTGTIAGRVKAKPAKPEAKKPEAEKKRFYR